MCIKHFEKVNSNWNYSVLFSDLVLAEMTLGESEPGPSSEHYREMLAKPNQLVYRWHQACVGE